MTPNKTINNYLLNNPFTNYQSDMMGYIEYSQITDIIKDLKNTFN